MKKLFTLLLAAAMLLSLVACGGKKDEDSGKKDKDTEASTEESTEPKTSLETFEMQVEPDGVDEPAKVTVGYPENFTMEEKDWCVILTDEEKDVAIEVYFTNDYNCYFENQEYAKDEYFFYEEAEYGDFDGYACMIDEESGDMEAYVYLACVADIDDVYMCFRIGSASRDLDADPQALYQLEEVQQVLNSVVYTAPAE